MAADWVKDFYSTTGRWWGVAESAVNEVDEWRAQVVVQAAPAANDILDLGCGYGSTCLALARRGFRVTGIDFSDRIDHVPVEGEEDRSTTFVKDDFHTHQFGQRFDVVTYWDGFGVGTDQDQLAVLDLVAGLLRSDGLAIIEVYDPIGFRQDHGLDEVKPANPARGYEHSLRHQRTFDETNARAHDSWTEVDTDQRWTQSLRCYSPAEFKQLVDQSALRWSQTVTEGRSAWSYVVLLTR